MNIPVFQEKDMAKTIHTSINDEYGYGQYDDMKIIVRKRDGWVNFSAFCEPELDDWLKFSALLVSSKDYEEVNDADFPEISGTYVSPLVLPFYALLNNPTFGRKCGHIINNFVVNGNQNESIETIKETLLTLDTRIQVVNRNVTELMSTVPDLKSGRRRSVQYITEDNKNPTFYI